jgi:hypothetical protein
LATVSITHSTTLMTTTTASHNQLSGQGQLRHCCSVLDIQLSTGRVTCSSTHLPTSWQDCRASVMAFDTGTRMLEVIHF